MKILATEQELCPLILSEKEILFADQRKALHLLHLSGRIREIYQQHNSNLVFLILECISLREAENYLTRLPLVRAGKSTFEIVSFEPYSGYSNLIK